MPRRLFIADGGEGIRRGRSACRNRGGHGSDREQHQRDRGVDRRVSRRDLEQLPRLTVGSRTAQGRDLDSGRERRLKESLLKVQLNEFQRRRCVT